MIKDIKQFLFQRGFEDNPYYWARCLYKYTDCGPWVSFVCLDEEARDVDEVAIIVKESNLAKLVNVDELSDRFVFFLSTEKKDRRWEKYRLLVQKYLAEMAEKDRQISVEEIREGNEVVQLVVTSITHVAAKTSNVYYEDIRKNGDTERILKDCIGIEVGSIVEGSDVEIGPEYFEFPFGMDAFFRSVELIDQEAQFYWDRDNSNWYCITSHGNVSIKETWGEWTWEGAEDISTVEREKIEKALSAREVVEYDKPFMVGEFEIVEYLNDYIY